MPNLAIKKLLSKGVKSLVGQNLFDKIINVELYKVADDSNSVYGPLLNNIVNQSRKFTITCNDGGVKPAIQLSVNLLPNNVCYQMTLKITNFSFRGQVNIRQLNVMKVTVGYRDGPQTVLTGPIFSSYQESPNPDGVTVFEGVAVGEQGTTLLNKAAYQLWFYKDSVTVKELCEKIALKLKLALDVTAVSKETLQESIPVEPSRASAANGLAVLRWLNDTLFRWSTSKEPFSQPTDNGRVLTTNDPHTLHVLWTDNTLKVIQGALLPSETDALKDVLILDAVKSASFDASVLHVRSLFIPALKPGGIFYMDPVYFTGGASMPNTITTATYNPDDGLYKAITVNVNFDTNGVTNEMDVMAVPLSQGGAE